MSEPKIINQIKDGKGIALDFDKSLSLWLIDENDDGLASHVVVDTSNANWLPIKAIPKTIEYLKLVLAYHEKKPIRLYQIAGVAGEDIKVGDVIVYDPGAGPEQIIRKAPDEQ